MGQAALMWAAYNGHTEICNILITKGANLDIQDIVSKYNSYKLYRNIYM